MKRQRGSILAGIMGLTVGITAALAGFLVLAGGSNRLEADSESETQLHYAAESAMTMGLRWLRTYPASQTIDGSWPAAPIYPISGVDEYTSMDGALVNVRFSATPPPEYSPHKLRCLATLGSGRDTLEINYYLDSTYSDIATSKTENSVILYKVAMSQWRETIHPGR